MSSTVSACIATFFQIKGLNYSISSACSTSAHCITAGTDAIRYGMQNIVFAGGGEELHWTLSVLFDAMGAMSSKYNDTPSLASRAYDVDRDGFVIAGGGGMVVLEDYDHAKAVAQKSMLKWLAMARIQMVMIWWPRQVKGAQRCMKLALDGFNGAGLSSKWIISMHMALQPQLVMSKSLRLFRLYLTHGDICQLLPQQSLLQAIHLAQQAFRKPSTHF